MANSSLTQTVTVAEGSVGPTQLAASAVTNAKIAAGALFTAATQQASTSGTAIDFTGIPTGTQMILIEFEGVSTNGTSLFQVQIGDSGGIETSSYDSATGMIATATASSTNATTGFLVDNRTSAAATRRGTLVLTLKNAATFTWAAFGCNHSGDIVAVSYSSGIKSLSDTLDRVRVTSVTGDTFDAGSINILYR